MSYSLDLRERVVNYVRNGGSPTEAARLFLVGRATLYRWLGAPDLLPKPAKERKRKLDKGALAAHVRDFPDALLRDRAAHFAYGDEVRAGRGAIGAVQAVLEQPRQIGHVGDTKQKAPFWGQVKRHDGDCNLGEAGR
jgi:hypothetical protein